MNASQPPGWPFWQRMAYLLYRLLVPIALCCVGCATFAGTVIGWGSTNYGELNLAGATNAVAVATGLNATLLLNVDGTVTALGASYSGPPMPTDLTNVVAVSGSAAHDLALRSDGTVAAWGEGFPKAFVPGGLSNVVAVATGFEHSLVLKSDGTVFGWGGHWGSTGDGPHVVPPGLSNVVAIAAGGGMSLALKQDATVVTWGGFTVPGDLTNAVAIAVGGYHALALRPDGTVVAWGDNLTGQLDVPPYLTNAVAISAGWYHSLALTVDGRIVAWGYNHGGQLDVPAGLTNVAAISAGYTHSLAILSDQAPQVLQPPASQTVIAGTSALFVSGASGALPLAWQWKFNGTNLDGKTGSTLLLTNVQPSQAGAYSIAVTNAVGGLESLPGLLTVVPFVLTSPTNQTAYVGDEVAITVSLQGSGPFGYQWQWYGTNLPTATNAVLVLPNVTTNQGGNYSVLVTNIYGAVQSCEAVLTVLDSGPFWVSPPASFVTWFGARTGFRPVVNGTKPLHFEWRFQGALLEDATNASLIFDGVTTNLAGIYSLKVTNVLGEIASPNLTLTVVPIAAWGASAMTNLPASLTNVVGVTAGGATHGLALKPNGSVIAWGSLATVPASVTNVAAIAATSSQSLALRSNGTVVTWNTITTVPATATNVAAIAVGGYSGALGCFALKTNGTLLAWGTGANGLITVPPGLDRVVAIAAGKYHALALRSDGTIAQWADSAEGRLNAVPTNLAGVVAVAARNQHSLALRSNGTVVAWGLNNYGQTSVPSGLSNVVAVAAGEEHSLALRGDGTVAIWGRNNYGQTNVPAGLSNVVEISGGSVYSFARLGTDELTIVRQPSTAYGQPRQLVLLSVGAVSQIPFTYQWQRDGTNLLGATNAAHRIPALGRSDQGQYRVLLEAGSTVRTSAPAQVVVAGNSVVAWGTNFFGQTNVPPGLNAVAVAGGVNHSLALRPDGTVLAWGANLFNVTNVPATVTSVVAIAAGTRHNLALKADRKVIAWGDSSSGKTSVPASLSGVRAIAAGDTFSLALKPDGKVEQWGALASAPSGLSNVVSIAAGYTHALAALSDGTALTWGSGAPALPPGLTNVISVTAGNGFSLALQSSGTIRAWGANTYGQVNVPASLSNVVAVSAGGYAGQALKSDGTLVTWGRDYAGLTNPPPGLSNVLQTAGGDLHSLAVVGSADPAIVRQPLATNYAAANSRVFLSVGAISAAPLTFQWRRDGTNLSGATNATLYLPVARASDTAVFSVLVSNAIGSVVSSNAFLQVVGYPPSIQTQPAGQTNSGGNSALFQVAATGTTPLTYQWRKDSQAIANATNSSLWLPSLRRTNEGAYTVAVSNQFGGTLSSNAVLRVLVTQSLQVPILSAEGSLDLLFSDSDGGILTVADVPHFEVQASSNLADWQALTNNLVLTNGLLRLQDPDATNRPQRFYRVLERP